MRRRIVKHLALLIAGILMVTSLPAYDLTVKAAPEVVVETGDVSSGDVSEGDAEVVITRAEWLSRLAQTFEMTVEDTYYPDNYFADLSSDSEYYYDILLNVQFGVVDVETGGEIRPEDPVTREFAAHTLNYCLGYLSDESMVFDCEDIEASEYRDDLYVAVYRGWFELVDGAFLPQQNITPEELTGMLEDASAVLEWSEVDEGAENVIELAEDVVTITSETIEVSYDEEMNATLLVTDLQENIEEGTRFAVYWIEIPTVYVAQSISVADNVTTISAILDKSGTAFTALEIQGSATADIEDIQPADGAELTYIYEETGREFATLQDAYALYGETIDLSRFTVASGHKLDLDDGYSVDVTLKIHNPKIYYDISLFKLYGCAYLECETELDFNGKFEPKVLSKINELNFVKVPIAGVGSFTVSPDISLSGTAGGKHRAKMKSGVEIGYEIGKRPIREFTTKSFTLVLEGSGKLGLIVKLGIQELAGLDAFIYAKAGGAGKASIENYVDGYYPKSCCDLSAYVYAEVGAQAEAKLLWWEEEYNAAFTIFDEKNSPIRIVKHYDDYKEVYSCARDRDDFYPEEPNEPDDGGSSGSGSTGSGSTGSGSTGSGSSGSGNTGSGSSGSGSTGSGSSGSGSTGSGSTGSGSTGSGSTGSGSTGSGSTGSGSTGSGSTGSGNTGSGSETPKKKIDYITPGTSYWGGSYWPQGIQSAGVDSEGNVVSAYEYKVTSEEEKEITITKYKGKASALIIPSTIEGYTVTAIGNEVFKDNETLCSVTIPNTVTSIGARAFMACEKLSTVNLSSNLEYLGKNAFSSCENITMIKIPESLNDTGGMSGSGGVFAGCSGLRSVTFETGTTQVAEHLFTGCDGLRKITIPDTVTSIGEYAFKGCTNLMEVTLSQNLETISKGAFDSCIILYDIPLPDSLVTIGAFAFSECEELCEIELPSSIKEIGKMAFENCDNIEEIHIPMSLETTGDIYEGGPFQKCSNLKTVTFEEGTLIVAPRLFEGCDGLENIVIPDSIVSIGTEAFKNASNLECVTFPEGLETINEEAFKGCVALTEVSLPDNITSMGKSAFDGCTMLSDVTLPLNVTKIGKWAFRNCDLITQIHIPKSLKETGDIYDDGPFTGCVNLKTVTFEEETEVIASCLFESCTGLESIVIPDSVVEIKGEAFKNAVNLKNVTYSSNLEIIGEEAFKGCTALTEVSLPDSVNNMGKGAYDGCIMVSGVTLPQNLAYMGKWAFRDCDLITQIHIPKALTKTGDTTDGGPFVGCDNLKTVTFEEGTTAVAHRLFESCTGLESIVIPDSVVSVGDEAFKNAVNLKNVTYSQNLTTIGNEAFKGCTVLTEVSLPDSVTQLANSAYDGCIMVSSITLPQNIEGIGKWAFRDCDLITQIYIPKTLKKAGDAYSDGPFAGCTNLKTVIFEEGITTVATRLFAGCDGLESIVIPDTVVSIGEKAFKNATGLKNVTLSQKLEIIGTEAFCGCTALESIVLPNRVEKIEKIAFKDCEALREITIPRTTTSIGSGAFTYPENMTIYGYKGYYAESYAEAEGITFVDLTIAAESVSFEHQSYKVNCGETFTLVPIIEPDNCTEYVVWMSSDESVATVDALGKVTAVNEGVATITATVGSMSAECEVHVIYPVESVTLNKTLLEMEPLGTFELVATVLPENATNRNIEWSSSDERVAVVSAQGVVTAVGKGNCIIAATATDGSGKKAECVVSVEKGIYIVDDVEALQSNHPYESNCNDIWLYTLEGAGALAVTFDEETYVKEGVDYIIVSGSQGENSQMYTGDELSGKTIMIDGDTVRIQMQAGDEAGEYGFKVASVQPVSYTIVYQQNNTGVNGTMANQTVQYKVENILSANQYSCPGYVFKGWNTEADGSGISYADRAQCSQLTSENGATVNLYAQWAIQTYKISYQLSGGTNNKSNPKTYNVTTPTITLKAPTKVGYVFDGWYSDKTYKTKVTSIASGSTGNKTLYAKWRDITYTINFNANGGKGTMKAMNNVASGKSTALTKNSFKRKGYVFKGWNTKKNGKGNTYKDKQKVKKLSTVDGAKVTLYAQWKAESYKITYKLDGGKNHKKNPKTYTIKSNTVVLKKPTKAGYIFKGWYSNKAMTKKVTKIAKGSTGNVTLYAKWEEK